MLGREDVASYNLSCLYKCGCPRALAGVLEHHSFERFISSLPWFNWVDVISIPVDTRRVWGGATHLHLCEFSDPNISHRWYKGTAAEILTQRGNTLMSSEDEIEAEYSNCTICLGGRVHLLCPSTLWIFCLYVGGVNLTPEDKAIHNSQLPFTNYFWFCSFLRKLAFF